MKIITFEFITKPISVNQSQEVVIRKGKGIIIKSEVGRAYIRAINKELMYQRNSLPFGFYDYHMQTPGIYRIDADNPIKPLLDIIVSNKRIADDAYMMKVDNEYYAGKNVKLTITERDFEECLQIRQYSPATVRKYRKLYSSNN